MTIHSRRRMLLTMLAGSTAALSQVPIPAFSASASPKTARFKQKALGCFIGGAIADAMGGPVEGHHWKFIAQKEPDFQTFLPYTKPYFTGKLGPGTALEDAAGNFTDDTYIRLDLTRFVLENDPPYTAQKFAPWLLAHGDLSNWWKVALRPLDRIKKGEVSAETAGVDHVQGGGGAWWQPIAILYAGDPKKASEVTSDMCRIWKGPLEQDILSSMVAGHAAAFKQGATIDSVVDAILDDSGPLAKKLFTRAVEIARKAKTPHELYEQLYQNCLVSGTAYNPPVDGPMPPHEDPIDYTDKSYAGILFAEQQPLALAYFVFGKGDPKRTVLTGVKAGRDADSDPSVSGSLLGALAGESIWPKEWVQTLEKANLDRVDLLKVGNQLADRALSLGNVRMEAL